MFKGSGKGKKKPARRQRALLLGLGLDSEKAIKINEKLAAKGKSLEQLSREEFDEIAAAVGLQRCLPNKPKNADNS